MEKEDILMLLDKKRRGMGGSSYNKLSKITRYSSRHLKRLIKRIEKEGINEILEHKNEALFHQIKPPILSLNIYADSKLNILSLL